MYNRPLSKENIKREPKAFEEFQQASKTAFIKSIRAVIDRYKQGLAFTYNHALYFDSSPEADLAVSFGAHEVHPHSTVYSPEITAAALRTTAKPFECIPTIFHSGWGEWTNKTTAQMKYECASIIYSEGNINLGDHMPHTGRLQAGVYKKIKNVFQYVKQRERYTKDVEPVPYAALLGFNGDFYWNRPLWSAARMLSDGHYQYDVISHKNLAERLPDYKLLILPYQPGVKKPPQDLYLPVLPELTRDQRESIKKWVKQGGHLLFNYGVNLFDCAGIELRGDYPDRVGYIEQTSEFAKDFDLPLLIRSPFKKIKCVGARPLLNWLRPYAGLNKKEFFSNKNTPAPGKLAPSPAVTINRYGRGRVIYCAFDLFSDYSDYMHPWTKALFLDILEIIASRKPFMIEAPSSVHTRLTRQGRELYLHLLNTHIQPPTIAFDQAGVFPPAVIEDIIPVHDIKITLPGTDITGASLEPGKKTLKIKKTKNTTVINVPEIKIYEIVKLR